MVVRDSESSSSSDDSNDEGFSSGSRGKEREKKKRRKKINRSRSRRTGSTDYEGVLSSMSSPEKRKLVQMAQASMSAGKEGTTTDDTQSRLTAYQRLAKESYNDTMEAAGLNDSQKDKEKRVARYVRKVLFKKVKFIFDKDLAETGRVARTIRGYLMWDTQSFSKEWMSWMGQAVRTAINEKRGGCNQLIASSVCTCKFGQVLLSARLSGLFVIVLCRGPVLLLCPYHPMIY